jgi:hypothetical protein
MAPPSTAQDKLTAYGLEAVLEDIANRKSLTAIAEEQGVSPASLLTWIASDAERSARVREMRAAMAKVWDEQAETEIRNASDDLSMRKAKELAHHYRWRAAKIAPPEYGDAVTLKGDKDNPLTSSQLADADLDARIRALMGKDGT